MIHAIEILADVAFNDGPILRSGFAAYELYPIQQALCRRQRALALATPIGVLDEAFVHVWVDLAIDRPLDNSVAEAQRHDQPGLGIVDVELPVVAHCVRLIQQVLPDVVEIFLQVKAERNDLIPIPLIARCFFVGG